MSKNERELENREGEREKKPPSLLSFSFSFSFSFFLSFVSLTPSRGRTNACLKSKAQELTKNERD